MTMRSTLLCLLFVAISHAFVPQTHLTARRFGVSVIRNMFDAEKDAATNEKRAAETAESTDSTTAGYTFDDYQLSNQNQGLVYKDTDMGEGDGCKEGDILTVSYKGKLMANGKQFDEGTFAFKVGAGKVMKGWDEGVTGMKKGGTRILRIPPSLGYGAMGAGDAIPPNADLQFEVKLENIGSGPIADAAANFGVGLSTNTYILGAILLATLIGPGLLSGGGQ